MQPRESTSVSRRGICDRAKILGPYRKIAITIIDRVVSES